MTTNHTPGPWRATEVFNADNESDGIRIEVGAGERIAQVHGIHREDFANARLIARAPALLAENERLRAALRAAFDHCSASNQKGRDAMEQARAALAKVEG